MQRRRLFSRLSRAAALIAWQQLFAPGARAQGDAMGEAAWRASEDVFTLGVASGEPRRDSVVLWTRLAPRPLETGGGMPPRAVEVTWDVAEDAEFGRIVRSGIAVAGPDSAHSVHVEVPDLRPDQVYFYRFRAGGQLSPTGRTRTAPHPLQSPQRLRVAMASCQHFEYGHFTGHREIAQADVDLVLFMGDYIYETPVASRQRVRRHARRFVHFNLDEYRIHHASYKLDADLRASHAAHPWLMIWDDHEVFNDYAGDFNRDVTNREDFLRVRTAAYRAYFEHLPISPNRAPVGPRMAMQARFQWGDLADFWLLDGRQFRSHPVCRNTWHSLRRGNLLWDCAEVNTSERTVLGLDQEAWLAQGLAGSMGQWKFVVQPTQISPSAIHTRLGPLLYADCWDAFPAARERLLEAIAQPRVPDVVCLGGDVHRHVAARLRRHPGDPASPVIASEITVTSMTSPGLSELLTGWMVSSNPDIVHARSDQRGYAILDITPERIDCEFRGMPHPALPKSQLRTQAHCVIERGVAGPRKVTV